MQRTVRKTTFMFIAATSIFVLLLPQWQTHSQMPVPTCKEKKLASTGYTKPFSKEGGERCVP